MTTRAPAVIHANPGAGNHRPDRTCACGPRVYTDLLEPARLVVVHRAPEPPDAPRWHNRVVARRPD